jgi:hypothetical protein
MQEKIDWLNQTICEVHKENEKLTKKITIQKKRSNSNNALVIKHWSSLSNDNTLRSFVKPKEAYIDLNSEVSLTERSILKDQRNLCPVQNS